MTQVMKDSLNVYFWFWIYVFVASGFLYVLVYKIIVPLWDKIKPTFLRLRAKFAWVLLKKLYPDEYLKLKK